MVDNPPVTLGLVSEEGVSAAMARSGRSFSYLAGHRVGAWWHQQQDMVVVNDGAPRLLSPLMSTDEMLVAG